MNRSNVTVEVCFKSEAVLTIITLEVPYLHMNGSIMFPYMILAIELGITDIALEHS